VTAIATTPALLPAVSGPRWPLFIAPLVGLIYYLAIRAAFQTAIGDVVPNTSDLDISPDAAPTKWASHWIYRLIAEAAAVTFGTFIAAGMARQRAAIAGLIGGFGISLWWTVYLTVIVLAQSTLKGSEALEPWYQYAIGACAGVAAPIVGYSVGVTAAEVATRKSTGFSGIPRAHFLWFWFPAYWYAAAIVPSIFKIYSNGIVQWQPPWTIFGLYVIPLMCFVVPLVGGLSLLSGEIFPGRPILRQALGVVVLVVGWNLAFAFHYGIISLVNTL
jgi:hypothetical protein